MLRLHPPLLVCALGVILRSNFAVVAAARMPLPVREIVMAPMEDRQLVVLALCGLGVELYVCIFRKRVMEIVVPIQLHRPDKHIVGILIPLRGGVDFPKAVVPGCASLPTHRDSGEEI